MTKNDFKILVIDDNPAIHADFIKILTFQNENTSSDIEKQLFGTSLKQTEQVELPRFQIDTALQGQEGVQLIHKGLKEGNPYALAFVDIRMPPGWDGIETIKHIWEIDPEIQVVICSAYSDYTWEETVKQLGKKENLLILKKPFDNVAVRQLAYALTKKWQLAQEKLAYTHLLEKRVEERTLSLEYQATHDPLTKLPNRVLFLDRLDQLIEQAKRHASQFAIIFFDLDRFKLINDSLGHNAGDELLKVVAERLQKKIRKSDSLARFGGDEFVVIATNLHHEGDAILVVNHLFETFRDPFNILNHEFMMGSSAGISIYPKNGENMQDLLRNADSAMYKAKESGGNQFQFYTEELSEQNIKRLEMESDLNNALLNNEFVLYYQPQYNINTKKMLSVEALLRWNHPKKGRILPLDFIFLAEETGLIVSIGEWVLMEACAQNKRWQNAGFPKIPVSVNMTSKEVKQPDLVLKIKDILNKTGLEPRYLEIELTENVIINMYDSSIKSLIELKKLGVHISLDDFGTGYSSMNYLRKIPLDRLKIDQSFVKNISLNTSDEIIIQSIITMARQLKLEVLAEGVESQKQLDFLKSKHCEEAQGYYLSQALSKDELDNLFRKQMKNK